MINLLIVEDDDLLRDLLKISLDSRMDLGLVGAVSDGETAIEYADRFNPDVVLMDIELGSEHQDSWPWTRRWSTTIPNRLLLPAKQLKRGRFSQARGCGATLNLGLKTVPYLNFALPMSISREKLARTRATPAEVRWLKVSAGSSR